MRALGAFLSRQGWGTVVHTMRGFIITDVDVRSDLVYVWRELALLELMVCGGFGDLSVGGLCVRGRGLSLSTLVFTTVLAYFKS